MVEEPEVSDAGGEQVQHREVEEQVSDQLLLPGLGVALGGLQGVHLRLQLLQDLLGGGLALKSQHTCWESWAYVAQGRLGKETHPESGQDGPHDGGCFACSGLPGSPAHGLLGPDEGLLL